VAATDLHDLAAAGQILDTTGNDPINRAFVSHGPPALDCCDQLAVHIANIGEATTNATDPLGPGFRHARGRVNLTVLIVTVTRCHPVIGDDAQIPTADELTAAAATLNADAWAIWNGLYRMRNELFAACDLVFFDACVPLPPQGGCAGYVMQIRFELGGYAPAVGS
jgi:hypothetical protein